MMRRRQLEASGSSDFPAAVGRHGVRPARVAGSWAMPKRVRRPGPAKLHLRLLGVYEMSLGRSARAGHLRRLDKPVAIRPPAPGRRSADDSTPLLRCGSWHSSGCGGPVRPYASVPPWKQAGSANLARMAHRRLSTTGMPGCACTAINAVEFLQVGGHPRRVVKASVSGLRHWRHTKTDLALAAAKHKSTKGPPGFGPTKWVHLASSSSG